MTRKLTVALVALMTLSVFSVGMVAAQGPASTDDPGDLASAVEITDSDFYVDGDLDVDDVEVVESSANGSSYTATLNFSGDATDDSEVVVYLNQSGLDEEHNLSSSVLEVDDEEIDFHDVEDGEESYVAFDEFTTSEEVMFDLSEVEDEEGDDDEGADDDENGDENGSADDGGFFGFLPVFLGTIVGIPYWVLGVLVLILASVGGYTITKTGDGETMYIDN